MDLATLKKKGAGAGDSGDRMRVTKKTGSSPRAKKRRRLGKIVEHFNII